MCRYVIYPLRLSFSLIHLNQLQLGANNACSKDLNCIHKCLAKWLNHANPPPIPLLVDDDCENRGLSHDATGHLLCPIEFDWDDPE